MAHPERFERPTPRFVVWCSIQLSYGCVLEARTYSGALPKARTTRPLRKGQWDAPPFSGQVSVETARIPPQATL